ncbi:MAG: WD40 repeat domain-containing protein [Methylococcaceae bacterium]
MAIGRGQTSISLWDFQMHSLRRKQLTTSGVFIQSLAFSSDSKILAASDDKGIVLWDLDGTMPKQQELDNNVDFIQAVAISPDGKLLAGGGNDAAVHLWDLTTHKQLPRPLLGHRGYVTSLAFHPDGTGLVSGSEDGTLIKWSLIPQWSEDGTFRKWSTISPVRHLLRNTGGVRSAAFSPDDHWLVTDGAEGNILVWDLTSGVLTPKRSIPTGRRVTNLAFAANGNSVVACRDDAHVRLWDIHAEQPRETVLSDVRCGSLAKNSSKVFDFDEVPSADGGSNVDRTLTVWEIPSGRVRLQSARLSLIDEFAVESTALSPDGKHFAVGMGNGMALLWDLRTNPPSRRELSGHNGPVTAVAFSPDSSLLASGGHDTTIRLWNVANGELQRPPMEEGDRIDYLAFNSTGTTLAVLYSRWSQGLSALHFWEVQTGKSLGSPLKGTDQHTIRDFVTFSPTGRWVISGGGEPMLWDMDLESWRTQACRRANRNLQPTEEWPLYMGGQPYRKTCPELPLPLSIPRVIHAVEDELF